MANDQLRDTFESMSLEALEAAVQAILALQHIEISVDEKRSLAKTLMRLAPPRLAGAIER